MKIIKSKQLKNNIRMMTFFIWTSVFSTLVFGFLGIFFHTNFFLVSIFHLILMVGFLNAVHSMALMLEMRRLHKMKFISIDSDLLRDVYYGDNHIDYKQSAKVNEQ